ncbi:MAG: hypothetical protein US42_C0003G0017 [Candidatus Magasanikbacteria bacterium GW2011_GWC2_37_14]|uniref:Uncharacterized protein n=1 Tax=Candidatus Magasanikbacteria bacterium GW2011_GWC2_37_14 TaxID=1619046 RepID=A0A0G0GP68_9BACT|nr:MAG: hypothetical protein US42_C0003G0017 [Candidatus Magasanikbacteria bacterium GW2011_GWC2_37_14]
MTYIVGILAIVVGCFMVIKTEWFLENFGSNAWAEEHLGSDGGSRLMYKLIGLAIIIIAMLGMTGLLGGIIMSIFSNLFMFNK